MVPLWFCANHAYYFLSLSGTVIEKVPLILLAFMSRFINVWGSKPGKCLVSEVSLLCDMFVKTQRFEAISKSNFCILIILWLNFVIMVKNSIHP